MMKLSIKNLRRIREQFQTQFSQLFRFSTNILDKAISLKIHTLKHSDDNSMLITDKEYNQMKKDQKKFHFNEINPLNAFNNKPVSEIKYFSKC